MCPTIIIFIVAFIGQTLGKSLENKYGPPPLQYNLPFHHIISQQNKQLPQIVSQQNPQLNPEFILKTSASNSIIMPLQQNLIPPTIQHHHRDHQISSKNLLHPILPPSTVAPVSQEQPPLIQKYFYFYSAPQEPAEKQETTRMLRIGQPKKFYRIVFIKTPASSRPQSLQVITAPTEEKTLIYVLAKHVDISDIQTDINVIPTEPSKPEVHFIKYKTEKEAEHAQHQIQAQYDALGGTSEISDEGLAPVGSVIGALENNENEIDSLQSEQSINNYLPPN